MTAQIEEIYFHSEEGDIDLACSSLHVKKDRLKKDQPVTFYQLGMPVFTMGQEEVKTFCDALRSLNVWIPE